MLSKNRTSFRTADDLLVLIVIGTHKRRELMEVRHRADTTTATLVVLIARSVCEAIDAIFHNTYTQSSWCVQRIVKYRITSLPKDACVKNRFTQLFIYKKNLSNTHQTLCVLVFCEKSVTHSSWDFFSYFSRMVFFLSIACISNKRLLVDTILQIFSPLNVILFETISISINPASGVWKLKLTRLSDLNTRYSLKWNACVAHIYYCNSIELSMYLLHKIQTNVKNTTALCYNRNLYIGEVCFYIEMYLRFLYSCTTLPNSVSHRKYFVMRFHPKLWLCSLGAPFRAARWMEWVYLP